MKNDKDFDEIMLMRSRKIINVKDCLLDNLCGQSTASSRVRVGYK